MHSAGCAISELVGPEPWFVTIGAQHPTDVPHTSMPGAVRVGGRASIPGGMDTAWRPSAIRKRCLLAGAGTRQPAALLLPTRGHLMGLQLLAARIRHLRAAGPLACCDGTVRRRRAAGPLCAAVDAARGRRSTILGLGRAHRTHLPASGARDRMVAHEATVVAMSPKVTYLS